MLSSEYIAGLFDGEGCITIGVAVLGGAAIWYRWERD